MSAQNSRVSKEWIKTEDELRRFRAAGEALASVLAEVMASVCPGMTTGEVDAHAERLIRGMGGIPIFKGYGAEYGKPFPATICASLNDEVVHGIPSTKRVIQEGDLLKIDIGIRLDGMVADMARTMAIGKVSDEAKRLMAVTEESLRLGIAELKAGAHITAYAQAVQSYVEAAGFSVVRDLVGHGVGRELHEDPQVPNFVSRELRDFTLEPGMTLALEPMVNAGKYHVKIASDDWAFITSDGSLSAHFENSVIITEGAAEVVTRPQ
jgi:methionyl aminopeptidase